MQEVEIRKGIRNYLLGEWENLVLLFPLGRAEEEKYKKFKAYCFRVTATNFLLRTGITGSSVSADDGQSYERITDGAGDDLLRNKTNPWTLYHYSLGVLEDNLRLYPRAPSAQHGGGFTYLDAGHPDPTEGDNYGYIPSSAIDYWNPPLQLENVSYMSGKETELMYGYYNESDNEVTPTLSIVGSSYLSMPVTKQTEKKKMVAGANPRRIITWGHAIRDSYSFSVPDEWEDAGNDITVESSNIQGGGVR